MGMASRQPPQLEQQQPPQQTPRPTWTRQGLRPRQKLAPIVCHLRCRKQSGRITFLQGMRSTGAGVSTVCGPVVVLMGTLVLGPESTTCQN